MSDTGDSQAGTPDTPPVSPPGDIPPPRHGCLTALMVVAGILFLLPGICTLAFSAGGFHGDPMFTLIAIIAFFFGIGGIWLIVHAFQRQRR